MIKIIGIGSLICEEWARESCPSLRSFQLVWLKDKARIFGKVNPQSLFRGDSNFQTREMASCFLEDKNGVSPIVSVFEIDKGDFPKVEDREYDYIVRTVSYYDEAGEELGQACAFFGYESDAAFIRQKPRSKTEYWPKIKKHYAGEIYRTDLLPGAKIPCPV